jgi:hypothetical protein
VEHAIYFSVGPALPHCRPTVVTGSKRSTAGSTRRGPRFDRKVKASIVEGVVVLLSLFDETPTCTGPSVRRAKCTQSRRQKASRDRCHRSTNCSNQATCWA